MRFVLRETFNETMPKWLKKIFYYNRTLLNRIGDTFAFDAHNAIFHEVELTDNLEERREQVNYWIRRGQNDPDILVFIGYYLIDAFGDITDQFDVIIPTIRPGQGFEYRPEQVAGICYATSFKPDPVKRSRREYNRVTHNKLYDSSQERVTFNNKKNALNPHSAHRFDASGYKLRDPDYYYSKLLSLHRPSFAEDLTGVYNKIVEAKQAIAEYQLGVDIFDNSSMDNVRRANYRLANAVENYNQVTSLVSRCTSEEELDEVFADHAADLTDAVVYLHRVLKDITPKDLSW